MRDNSKFTAALYNLKDDIAEKKNLAGIPEYAEVKKMMRKGLPTHHEPSGVTYDPSGQKRKASVKIMK